MHTVDYMLSDIDYNEKPAIQLVPMMQLTFGAESPKLGLIPRKISSFQQAAFSISQPPSPGISPKSLDTTD